MEVPSLLCSWAGSMRASTAVLSHSVPTPGAVMAAQAVPEDCEGAASYFWRSRSALVATAFGLTTVMSAPTRASQNGNTDRLTETDDAPLPLRLEDHAAPLSARPLAAARPFAGARFSVEASTLSWLQSR